MKEIRIEHIYKSYGKKQALTDVSLEITEGTIFGLIGPSGCGKTTLVKIATGILKPNSGRVEIFGETMPSPKAVEDLGYMAQAAALYPTLTGRENLAFFGKIYGLKGQVLNNSIDHVTKLTDLTEDLDKRVDQYSGGMQQRLSLATALIHDPKVLLLDEPTVGIDPVLRQEIWRELRKLSSKGTTILITTHVMDEAEKCDSLAMMREGKVLAVGSADELVRKAGTDNFEDAFIALGRKEDSHEN